MFKTLKKINPFGNKTNYKELYEYEKAKRTELEKLHKTMCTRITTASREFDEAYSLYKTSDRNKEF